MNFELLKTNSTNKDFIKLTELLDNNLNTIYGGLQEKYNKLNNLSYIKDAIVIYSENTPVACGAFKEYDALSVEIKRIFVKNEFRRNGLAKLILSELETIAKLRGYQTAVLQTGSKQPEAIELYKSSGYRVIENYGPYIGDDNSICMKKSLA